MDLLTSSPANEEQQELSARALRACLAAEAALASLRAECSPLQSSLPWVADAGSRNLELAHRSLQLQIDACESLTLCATAAFKQLCDAHFLPSSRNGASSQLVHNCYPSTKSCTEYESKRNWKCQACKGNVHLKSEMHPREEAPTGFGNPLSSLLSLEPEEAPGDSRNPHKSIPRSLSKLRPSNPSEFSHKALKDFAGRSHLSEPQSPMEFCGKRDAPSSQDLAKGDGKPNMFAPVGEAPESSIDAPPSLGFETKFMTRTPSEGQRSRPCSSYKEYAEGSGSGYSNLPLKNLSASGSQLSGSQAVSRRNLQSSRSSSPGLAGNREFLTGEGSTLPIFSSTTSIPVCNEKIMLTDHQSSVHRQEADGNVVSNSAAHLSCRAGRPIASVCCGSAERSPHSTKSAQSLKFVDGPCPLPNLNKGTQGNNSSSFRNQRATPQSLGTNQSQDCKNGQFLHLRTNSSASSSDLHSGFLSAVDNLESDKSQARRRTAHHENHGGGQKGMDSPSSLSTGFAESRGRHAFDEPVSNFNKLFTQPSSFVNPNAAGREYENSALPRAGSAMNEECGHSRGDSAFPQIWPYALTSDAHPNSTSVPSNFAIRSFAAAESLRPCTKDIIQENTKSFESEACTLNDLKNWQVVTRLDAEFPDMSFWAHNPRHNGTKEKIEEKADTVEDKVSTNCFEVPCDLKQPKRALDIVARFVDVDSEDDTDEDGDYEDGEDDNYESTSSQLKSPEKSECWMNR